MFYLLNNTVDSIGLLLWYGLSLYQIQCSELGIFAERECHFFEQMLGTRVIQIYFFRKQCFIFKVEGHLLLLFYKTL